MTFAEKLMELRRQRGLSQEQLGAEIGVSRQTVSKWELGSTTPELEKLIALSDYFEISIDELVGRIPREEPPVYADPTPPREPETPWLYAHGCWEYEYKSQRELFGLPLVHIHLKNHGAARAKGIFAIGNIATGVFALGGVAAGGIAFGGVSLGLLALGGAALGLLSLGGLSLGVFSWGGIAIGYLAVGGLAAGFYAAGGCAFGAKIAVGDMALAPLALDRYGQGLPPGIASVQDAVALKAMFPSTPNWILRWMLFLYFHL